MSASTSPTSNELLVSVWPGFDQLFTNDLPGARRTFATPYGTVVTGAVTKNQDDLSAFHQLGLGVAVFLEAALGLENERMVEAAAVLSKAVAATAAASKAHKDGVEYEILNADAVVLSGICNALSESYMGYLQCLYALNSAHGKFTKLYKTVFPEGLDGYNTPSMSRKSSNQSLASSVSSTSTAAVPKKSRLFGGWASGSTLAVPVAKPSEREGPIGDMILSGTAFGFGLFNLVFSLLPKGAQSVVGFLGFKHDRKLALRALAVAAAKSDVHSVFAGLVLMTYHGVVLLMSGYQADEEHILKQYRAIVDKVATRYPGGSLWILNRAKILRMSGDALGAIDVLQKGLEEEPDAVESSGVKAPPLTRWRQADTLLVFELAWTLLGERRYAEAGKWFVRMTELNAWSHATYYFIATGCWAALANETSDISDKSRKEAKENAKRLWDMIPGLLDGKGRKMGGKELPTEVLIRKKLEFYKEKQTRWEAADVVDCMVISPAEEMAVFWNTHSRIDRSVAEAHICEWTSLEPRPTISFASSASMPQSPSIKSTTPTLDTPDELAIRALLLGVVLRTVGDYDASKAFLEEASKIEVKVSSWVRGVALFEEGVVILKALEARERETKEDMNGEWNHGCKEALGLMDRAMAASPNAVDLSSRLDSRVTMLRDEIALKKEMVGINV